MTNSYMLTVARWIIVLGVAPVLVVAIEPPSQLQVLTPDQIIQSLGFQTSFSSITDVVQRIGSDIGSRFLESRGGEVVEDINAKTGVDLVKFFQFVIGVIYYLFVEIYAVLIDIATKLGAS